MKSLEIRVNSTDFEIRTPFLGVGDPLVIIDYVANFMTNTIRQLPSSVNQLMHFLY